MSGFPVLPYGFVGQICRTKRAGLFLIFYLLLALPAGNAFGKGAICLLDSTEIQVKQNLTAEVKFHKSFEITSDAGIRLAQVIIPVNDYIEVSDINGFTELPGGQLIKLSKKDISASSLPGSKGLNGTQAVAISLRTPTAGSRIYYEYKLEIKSLLYLPRITRRTDYITKRLVVNLRWDKGVNLHYDSEGVDSIPGTRNISFFADDLAEVPDEPESCPDRLHISISAEIFSYGKIQYYSRNWPDVGRFFALLAVQPLEADTELKTLSQRLCINSRSREDTLKAFFEFLADSVSYVALQMGKGDFTPQACSVVLSRRFGDCKDQSVLLTSLCRVAGLDAYPALVNTRDFPAVDYLHPWPAWFDHVITVVHGANGDLLLDPSDPLATPTAIPPRLRGKSYLICDGRSELKAAPSGPIPAFGIAWNFRLNPPLIDGFAVDFSLNYYGDAAEIYRGFWQSTEQERARLTTLNQLKSAGWNLANLELLGIQTNFDTLETLGRFAINFDASPDSHNISIASPLGNYLIDNLFSDMRKNDYCRSGGSLRLEETIVVKDVITGVAVGPEYSDSWNRPGLSFADEMAVVGDSATYHRIFEFAGETLKASDYNAFRDFLLSRRDQQYIGLRK
jgi:transglutaminase-like putative cysteine protease